MKATQDAWRPSMYSPIVPQDRRRRPGQGLAAHLLEREQGRCAYCTLPVGATVLRRGRLVRLRLEWDHFVPYSILLRNPGVNWQLACHICNGIKSANRYDTVDEAAQVIRRERSRKGYEDIRDTWTRLVAEPYSPWGEPPDEHQTGTANAQGGAQ